MTGLFYILGWASPSLRQLQTQALQEWLASEPVAAAAENVPHMEAHVLILGRGLPSTCRAAVFARHCHLAKIRQTSSTKQTESHHWLDTSREGSSCLSVCADSLDACFASQTVALLATPASATSEEARAVWQRAPWTKETAKGVTARPWTAAGGLLQPEHLQHAKLAALRVQLALSAYHLVEGDRTSPFAKGTTAATAFLLYCVELS